MRADDFERLEECQICKKDAASVYTIIACGWFTCKAHVCFACFGELEECGGRCVQSVSLQDFKGMPETPTWSECEQRARGRREPETGRRGLTAKSTKTGLKGRV
jgi:hypothetical protein